jgi:predicted nucleotide-binding protein
MTKKDAQKRRPALTISREEAKQRIEAQIERAKSVPNASVNENDEARRWYEFAAELLRQLFTTDEMTDEFVGRNNIVGSDDISTGYYLKKLISIYERLDLYPEINTPILAKNNNEAIKQGKKIFIIHGHDEAMKQTVARTLEKLGLTPVILHEQPNIGRTIIEKFTVYSDVSFAIALLSPDDVAHSTTANPKQAKFRARQNVILELGFFLGKLGRNRVVVLFHQSDNFEMPSDYSGVLFVPYGEDNHWQFNLLRELKACGYDVDANKLLD